MRRGEPLECLVVGSIPTTPTKTSHSHDAILFRHAALRERTSRQEEGALGLLLFIPQIFEQFDRCHRGIDPKRATCSGRSRCRNALPRRSSITVDGNRTAVAFQHYVPRLFCHQFSRTGCRLKGLAIWPRQLATRWMSRGVGRTDSSLAIDSRCTGHRLSIWMVHVVFINRRAQGKRSSRFIVFARPHHH
jgi:hypothetical protein